jgi:hypothetical protein
MSPIHDQSYRHYEGERRPLGRAWSVIARTGIRRASRAAGSRAARRLVDSVLVRRPDLLVTMYPSIGGQLLAVDAHRFMQFIEQQASSSFLSRSSRLGPDRERSPRERAADLSVEAAAAHGSTSAANSRSSHVPDVRHAGARDLAAVACR